MPQTETNELLLNAVRKDDIPSIHIALDRGADIHAINNQAEQDNAIMVAIIRNTTDCIKTLIEAGANVNFQKSNGSTSLIYAATAGYDNVVEQLIHAKAHIDAKNNDDRTALMMSAMNGHADCLERLVDAGANIHLADKNGITPLGLAVLGKKNRAIEKLISFGANLDVLDDTHKKTYAKEIKAGTEIFTAKKWQHALQKQQRLRRLMRQRK